MKGNVIDLAVGVIIGTAFGKIISSLVADVIMPPLGLLLGGVNFSHLVVTLKQAAGGAPAIALNYGLFIQAVVDFLIIASAIFLAVKGINKLKKPEPAAAPKSTNEEVLLGEIRDILKRQRV